MVGAKSPNNEKGGGGLVRKVHRCLLNLALKIARLPMIVNSLLFTFPLFFSALRSWRDCMYIVYVSVGHMTYLPIYY